MIYPLFIFGTQSGEYDGYFPDIPGCFFAGDTLEDAVRAAEKAFGVHAEALTERGEHVPAPTDPSAYIHNERL